MISPIRFGGIASGMDTENMIKDLMRAERMPMDRIFQGRQWAEWQRDSYREVNSKMLEFRNVASDMRLQGTFMERSVTSTNASSVTAKAVGAGANFTSQIKVDQVAKAAFINSSNKVGNLAGDEVFDANDLTALAAHNGKEFKINGETFTVNGEESLNQLITRINNSDAGVSAFYDTHTGKMSISAKDTGDGGIEITDLDANGDPVGTGFAADFLNLDVSDPINYFAGQNAQFTLNGLATERSGNNFTINGIEYSVHGASDTATTISSTTDTDAIFDKVKNFVDKYNELIEHVNGKLTEKRYRDFQPLTDEQRGAMSEQEAEMWDEKAKSGLLAGDRMISNMVSDMRTMMSNVVSGLGDGLANSLSSIGINTGDYSERGKLHINEAELREAITANPEEVMSVFTANGDSDNERGIGRRIYESMNSAISLLTDKAGREGSVVDNSSMNRQLRQFDERLLRFESRLQDVEDRYWRQFTSMEKAMSELNSQGDWLMQHLAAGQQQ